MEESSFVLPAEEYDQAPSNLRIIQAAKSNPRAFGELYLLYVQPVFRYLYSRVGNLHDAEDLTAQTFLTALEALDGLREESHFAAWLFTIARHKAMDTFRRKKNETSIDEIAQMGDDPDPLSGVIHSEQVTALSRLVQKLPEEERELLRLRFLAEMSFREIAYFLHRNENAVKKSVYRLLARLHSQLEIFE